ncbi:hypothetical protein ACWEWI_25710 [Streptomyces sp. NPDC003753]
MWSAIVSLVVAVVGVCGTLASALLTQHASQRAKLQELEHTERVRLAEQEAEREQRRADELRACYVKLNAQDRHYRDAMLAYAYALKGGSPAEAEAETAEVTMARRAQRDARAEAQMVVSDTVLSAEGEVNYALTQAYRRLKEAESAPDATARVEALDEAIALLNRVIPMLGRVRVLMRTELGVTNRSEHCNQIDS